MSRRGSIRLKMHSRPILSSVRRALAPRVEGLESRELLSVIVLKDINPQDQFPGAITRSGDYLYYVSRDAAGGYNLERTDLRGRSSEVLFNDRNDAGYTFSTIHNLFDDNGTLYFTVDDTLGTYLEKIDPTTGSLSDVADSSIGLVGSIPFGFGELGQRFVFETANPNGSRNIVASDGTTAGTVVLRESIPYSEGTSVSLVTWRGRGYFVVPSSAGSDALWVTDGTVAGTHAAFTPPVGDAQSSLGGLWVSDSSLFFSVGQSGGAVDLWASDGTLAGSTKLYSGTIQTSVLAEGSNIYFAGRSSAGSDGLFMSDGTVDGTRFLITAPPNASEFENLTIAGTKVYFTTNQLSTGPDTLWVTNGTPSGTLSLAQLNFQLPGPSSTSAGSLPSLVAVGTAVYFAGWDATHGTELWRSDGTLVGTAMVADILPGSAGSDPTQLATAGDKVAFAAHDTAGAGELWTSDGTSAGTQKLVTLTTPHTAGGVIPTNGINDGFLVGNRTATIGPITYFAARDPDHGEELWKTDGTPSGTVLVKDINPGLPDSSIYALTNFRGTLLFFAVDGVGRPQLYKSDGTAAGTVPVSSNPAIRGSFLNPIVIMGAAAYWVGYWNDSATLFKTDGNDGGTVRLSSAPEISAAAGADLTAAGSRLFFSSSDSPHGTKLWVSDGMLGGTTETVASFQSGTAAFDPADLTAVGSTVFFIANDGVHGAELWRSDGTAAGTSMVSDLLPGAVGSNPLRLQALGSEVIFLADAGVLQKGLFASDGTAAGTVLLKDYSSVDLTSFESPCFFTTLDSTLYYAIRDGDLSGLYKTDGTPAGTSLVTAISPDVVDPLVTLNGHIYFSVVAFTGNTGLGDYFYRSDGTEAGTVNLGRVGPSNGDTPPEALSVLPNGRILLFGDDGFHGPEPMLLDPSTPTKSAPALYAMRSQTIVLGQTVSQTAAATDSNSGDTIQYSLGSDAPAGATIDPVTGAFAWNPTATQGPGTYRVTIVATDNETPTLSDSEPFFIHVRLPNQPPSLAPIADQTIPRTETLVLTTAATDPDTGETITYSLAEGAPAGARIDSATGTFSWTPPTTQGLGSYPITIIATDNGTPALSASRTFTVIVTPEVPPPAHGSFAFAQPAFTVSESGGSATITVVRLGGSDGPATVSYSTTDGSALSGVDYTATSGTLTFVSGQSSTTISVPVLDQGLVTGEKSLVITLRNPTGGASLGAITSANLVIQDNDVPTAPPVSVSKVAVVRKGSLVTSIVLTVSGVLQRTSAEDTSHYAIVVFTQGRRRTLTPHVVPLSSVSYNPTLHKVTLRPAGRLVLRGKTQLTINGLVSRDGRPVIGRTVWALH